nr:hypothetical protein [Bacteroidota bacterium]
TFNSELKSEDFGKLEAVNIEALRNRIGVLHGMLGRYLSILQQRQSDTFFTLSYEDLYTDNVNRNRKKVAEVFNFLGLDIPETKKIYVILNPEKGKINSAETYRLIPNIYEVEAALGSDQTGWLFR